MARAKGVSAEGTGANATVAPLRARVVAFIGYGRNGEQGCNIADPLIARIVKK